MDNNINFSIIIPTAGRSYQLANCLESIGKYITNHNLFEVLVIDNNQLNEFSKSVQKIVNKYTFCKYIKCENPGLTSARHMGLKNAFGNILCFVDDDIEFSATWFESTKKAFNDKSIALVGGPTLPNFQTTVPFWFWSFIKRTPYGGWSCEWLSLLDIGKDIIDINPNYIWGLNFSIRKEVLIDCNGFNIDIVPKEYLRWQGDGETGLTEKLREKGYKAAYKQNSLLYHYCGIERLNIEYFKRRAYFEGTCNCYKNLRILKIFKSNPFLFRYNFLILELRYILRKNLFEKIKNFIYIFKANKEILHIKKECFKSFNRGYYFLLNEVKNDKKHINWIWKDNYLDSDVRNQLKNASN